MHTFPNNNRNLCQSAQKGWSRCSDECLVVCSYVSGLLAAFAAALQLPFSAFNRRHCTLYRNKIIIIIIWFKNSSAGDSNQGILYFKSCKISLHDLQDSKPNPYTVEVALLLSHLLCLNCLDG